MKPKKQKESRKKECVIPPISDKAGLKHEKSGGFQRRKKYFQEHGAKDINKRLSYMSGMLNKPFSSSRVDKLARRGSEEGLFINSVDGMIFPFEKKSNQFRSN